ncbi:hypothetical protein KY290_008146 [Solanum tuberosum]|uniref:Reverse transcriptase zinc-binding domain-containing protein n=1 Tax=Solanum tuberosum TaxID=4113 RepID=A0ABQ7W817_SOLTU|nr:hypothetical protein KY290_008146 [Solanum tuberosum]
MLEVRDKIDQPMWWEPKIGHSSLWWDNLTQIGALHYYLPMNYEGDHPLEEVCSHIAKHVVLIPNSEEWDRPWWMLNRPGKFSIKSTWNFLRQNNQANELFKNIWIKGMPYKIYFFMWRLWKKKIPMGEVLTEFVEFVAGAGIEGPFHHLKNIVWNWWKTEVSPKLKPIYKTVPLFILWQIWKRRNKIKYGGKMSQISMSMVVPCKIP